MRSKRRKAATEPTAIPIMAAVESFFDFLCSIGILGWIEGEGAGEGKNGEQDGNGPPQSWRFPAKEDAGNLDSVVGIEPFRRLFETLKSVNPNGLMLGIVPLKPLFCK